jgi:hypothetical protein
MRPTRPLKAPHPSPDKAKAEAPPPNSMAPTKRRSPMRERISLAMEMMSPYPGQD